MKQLKLNSLFVSENIVAYISANRLIWGDLGALRVTVKPQIKNFVLKNRLLDLKQNRDVTTKPYHNNEALISKN